MYEEHNESCLFGWHIGVSTRYVVEFFSYLLNFVWSGVCLCQRVLNNIILQRYFVFSHAFWRIPVRLIHFTDLNTLCAVFLGRKFFIKCRGEFVYRSSVSCIFWSMTLTRRALILYSKLSCSRGDINIALKMYYTYDKVNVLNF